MQKRTYLTITPDNRAEAIRRAGKLPDGRNTLEYDPDEKLWFAREEPTCHGSRTGCRKIP